MLIKKSRIENFDDWVDIFHQWHADIGYPTELLGQGYHFETKLDETESNEIEFGHFAGRPKWEKLTEIPDQRIRDALAHLIEFQGDTEFASVEQQKNLLERAPSEVDLKNIIRINREEMRHGWQMAYVLVTHFGDSGKFQLNMLSRSAFAPLGRSTLPMLQEEAYHLAQGNLGLMRIVKAGRIPIPIIQKYFNKWLSTAFDLFGQDESSSAHWAYVWGLKGRYDENLYDAPADMDKLNELSRATFFKEVSALVDALNNHVPESQPKLRIPNDKFRRHIGAYAGKSYGVGGKLLSQEDYEKHLKEVMPSDADDRFVINLEKEKEWILEPKQR